MASAEAERIRADLFPSRRIPPWTISELRRQEDLGIRHAEELPDAVTITSCRVAGLYSEWVRAPGAGFQGTMLYLHGGGFVGGRCATHRKLVAHLAVATHCNALLLEYRLAPEHSFPASLVDAMAAYHELLAEGTDPRKLVVIGDSAGGGLCAALLLALKDAGTQMPAAAVLISPWTDLTLSGDTYRTRADLDPIDRLPALRQMVELYLCGRDPKTPLASPIFGDLRGLPQILIQVGDHEVLLSDSTRFFERAKAMGVQVKMEVWPEMWHCWHMSAPALPEANEAIQSIGSFIRQAASVSP